MPWTIGDVNRHKIGLSDTQKRQWVRIANSALRKCQANGGSNCDASAIRQANGAVKTNMRAILSTNAEYTLRREIYNNRTHLVVPVTIMVEGVHDGNQGPLYHPSDELGAAADAWNGRPVTISHPQSGGEFVSVSIPGVIQQYAVGKVFDVHIDGDRLRGEAWIEETQLRQKSPEAFRTIERGEPLEVSAGLFSDDEILSGEWNGETYNAISRNHRPDHLALLPGEVGACSWDDGCGVRANKEGGKTKPMENENVQNAAELSKEQHLANLIANAESGYREIMSLIQSKLDAMDTDILSYYTEDVYDDYFIYTVRSREIGTLPKLYKRGYSVNEGGVLAFAEEPAEVRKQVSYVALKEGGLKRTKFNSNKKEVKMPNEKQPCCEDVVDALIANAKTKFDDKDKEWLMTLKEEQIAKIVQDEVKQDPPVKKEEPVVEANVEKKSAVTTNAPPKYETAEDFLKSVPSEFQEQLSSGLRLHQETRANMVKAILANTNEGVWTEDGLKEMKIETLEGIFKSVVNVENVADYSFQAEPEVSESGVEPLMRVVPKTKEA